MVSYRQLILFAGLVFLSFSSIQSFALQQLFTTPEEREYLDYLRTDFLERTALQGFDIQTEEIPDIETEALEQNVEFRLDAVITNQDGSHTIWLNGSPIREMDLPQDVDLVHLAGKDTLKISTSSVTYLLRPGQTVNLSTGQLWESFEPHPNSTASTEDVSTEQIEPSTPPISPVDGTIIPNPEQPLVTTSSRQGVVAIQDLIEALQMIQSGNEETSDTAQ